MPITRTFPAEDWITVPPSEVRIAPEKLAQAKSWLDQNAPGTPAIVRHGYLIAEWTRGIDSQEKIHIASAVKSLISSMIGIAEAEGKIRSADDLAVDYFPEFMDVPEGRGPKEGRYAFEANRRATIRQLICNVSGYLKPGEEPGKVFNYQTTGMCAVTHCIETAYGVYDVNDPEGSPKIPVLYREKIADPIQADFDYRSGSQKMQEHARLEIFGWGTSVRPSLRDHARLGWLWCNFGRWGDRQVIPEAWMREAGKVNRFILENCSENTWRYGHGFWSNEYGKLWPNLDRDSFTSWGAGGHYAISFPSRDLVIIMDPVEFEGQAKPYETTTVTWLKQQEVLKIILNSVME